MLSRLVALLWGSGSAGGCAAAGDCAEAPLDSNMRGEGRPGKGDSETGLSMTEEFCTVRA